MPVLLPDHDRRVATWSPAIGHLVEVAGEPAGDSRVRLIRLTLPPLLSVKHAPLAATRYDA